ncbi:hypothetical protein quinque_007503 [Culex quinquefasciatus]
MKGSLLFVSTMIFSSTVLACIHPVKHYTTLGCTPSEEFDAEGCPLSYNCPTLYERDPDKCYLLGREYDIGQSVPPEESISSCYFMSCYQNFENKTEFAVAIADCFFPIEPDTCILQYEPNQCCSTRSVCGDDREYLVKCTVNGRSYYEGERVYLEDRHCQTCLCTRASGGCLEGEVTCQDHLCDFEVFNIGKLLEGAAPVYDDVSCCPIDWRLPQETDAVALCAGSYSGNYAYQQCLYGNLTLNQGESLVPSITQDGKYKCSCAIPPMVHCILERKS